MMYHTRQYYSLIDRHRIVTSVSTSNFVGNWSSGEDSYAVDAPNAVLVVDSNNDKTRYCDNRIV